MLIDDLSRRQYPAAVAKRDRKQEASLLPKLEPKHSQVPALDPATAGQKIVKLRDELLLRYLKQGPEHKFYEVTGDRTDPTSGSPLQQVLAKPRAVFSGVRDYEQGGYCYCGLPTAAYTNGGSKVPPRPGMIYCVYVDPRDWVYEWGWEVPDEIEVSLPEDYDAPERFERMIWPAL